MGRSDLARGEEAADVLDAEGAEKLVMEAIERYKR